VLWDHAARSNETHMTPWKLKCNVIVDSRPTTAIVNSWWQNQTQTNVLNLMSCSADNRHSLIGPPRSCHVMLIISAHWRCHYACTFTYIQIHVHTQSNRCLSCKELAWRQGCIGGYTRVYAVYQPPVYFSGVYSPQLLYINRVYAGYTLCRVACVCPNYPTSRQFSHGLGLSTSVMCQRLRLECCDASKFNRSHACVTVCYLLVSYNWKLPWVRCFDVVTKIYYSLLKLLLCLEFD